MKQIFKEGDRVYNNAFGWCTIDLVNIEEDSVYFSSDEEFNGSTEHFFSYSYATKIFSFTEYEVKGFSQERPINYEDYIGCWGRFWDYWDYKIEGVLEAIKKGSEPFHKKDDCNYKYFEPYPQEVLTALGLINEK